MEGITIGLIEETTNAARVGWFIQAATINDGQETAVAMNPTDPEDQWVFIPDDNIWMNMTTSERMKTIPLCKHKPKETR